MASRDAMEYREYILKHSNDDLAANKWWFGLHEAIASLETLPHRCSQIPEQKHFAETLHQLLYKSHRIIFQIDKQVVSVARIYHSALRPLRTLNQRPRLSR